MALPVQSAPAAIPQRIHLVWVGSPVPGWVASSVARWRATEPEVTLWTEQTLAGTLAEAAVTLGSRYGLDPRAVADMVRVLLLAEFGGVYFDVDTLPLHPVEPWTGDRPAWIGAQPGTENRRVLNNAWLGFPPWHPLLADVWSRCVANVRRGVTSPHHATGTYVWRKAWEGQQDLAEVYWTFPNLKDGDLQRAVREGRPLTSERWADLRERFPGCPAVHVTFYGGER